MTTSAPRNPTEAELHRLIENSARRRQALRTAGQKKLLRKKLLTVFAGILALISAASFTAVLTEIAGGIVAKAFSVAVALASGTISLVTNAFLNDEELVAMLAGSSRYLGLREKMRLVAMNPDMDPKKLHVLIESFQEEYIELDALYSRFIDPEQGGSVLQAAESPLFGRS